MMPMPMQLIAKMSALATPTAAKGAIAATWHQLSVVVVGDLAKLGALTSLDLPMTVVDADGVPVPVPATPTAP